ncbi:MAG: RpiB/LacA/LacB family sugar-phosphate isomerase [Bacilli bacterium]|nr:RpiB/LacA/LacB family sugar-phosphate isomerase [Bacilli bacterium]
MKIAIASDHRGFVLKGKIIDYLKDKYEILDLGTNNEDAADYPIYGIKLGETVANKEVDLGIAICGSGIGISIACNKVKGIRCAKVDSIDDAYLTRKDNDANVIALNGSIDFSKAIEIIDKFLNTPFEPNDRYIRRINEIKEYEETTKI